jgi:hypothetical protein
LGCLCERGADGHPFDSAEPTRELAQLVGGGVYDQGNNVESPPEIGQSEARNDQISVMGQHTVDLRSDPLAVFNDNPDKP